MLFTLRNFLFRQFSISANSQQFLVLIKLAQNLPGQTFRGIIHLEVLACHRKLTFHKIIIWVFLWKPFLGLANWTVFSEGIWFQIFNSCQCRPLIKTFTNSAFAIIASVKVGLSVIYSWNQMLVNYLFEVKRASSHAWFFTVLRSFRLSREVSIGAWGSYISIAHSRLIIRYISLFIHVLKASFIQNATWHSASKIILIYFLNFFGFNLRIRYIELFLILSIRGPELQFLFNFKICLMLWKWTENEFSIIKFFILNSCKDTPILI